MPYYLQWAGPIEAYEELALERKLATRQLVVPGERYDMAPPCFAIVHHLRAGHRLVLRVTTSDADKVPLFSVDPAVTVFTGADATRVSLPVVPGATLHANTVASEGSVVLGPAHSPVSGTVTPTLGLPARVAGTTTAFFEFDSLAEFDNAKAVVRATPSTPADVDLYLQRRRADGTWTGDPAAARPIWRARRWTTGRLLPGRYRVEAHAWAALPATSVALGITFHDSAGTAGA